jgi:hypothetical protein
VKNIFSNTLISIIVACFLILITGVSYQITLTMVMAITVGAALSSTVIDFARKFFGDTPDAHRSPLISVWALVVTVALVAYLFIVGPIAITGFLVLTFIATGGFMTAFLPLFLEGGH